MADSSATFAVRLEDETSGAAQNAAKALQDLKQKILADQSALADMNRAMKNLQGGTNVSIASFKQLKDQIAAKKVEIAGAQDSFLKLGGTFGKASKEVEGGGEEVAGAAKEGAVGIEALGQSVKGALGPMGGFIDRAQTLIKGLGKAGVAGVIAIVVIAIIALATALITATIAFAKFAIASANSARNQRLAIETLGVSAKEASRLSDVMEDLRKSTGLSFDEQTKLLGQLKAAKVPTAQWGDALKALALAQAGGGDEAVKQLVDEMKAGKSAAVALGEAQGKFGDVVKRKMLDLDTQLSKFHEDIAGLFRGIVVEPFLKALQKLLSMFDSNTATGRALKAIVTAIGQKLIDIATAVLPYIVSAMKTIVIWGLKAYIAWKQFWNSPAGSLLIIALKVIGVTLGVLIAAVAAFTAMLIANLAAPIGLIVSIIALFSAVIDIFADLWSKGSGALGGITDAIGGVLSALAGFVGQFLSAGANMVLGLAQGILGSGSAVLDAISNVAGGAIKWAMHILGIGSPSKAFKKIGGHTAEGFAEGIDKGAGDAQGAMEGMVSLPAPPAARAPQGGARGGGGPISLTVNVDASGQKSPEDIGRVVAEKVKEVLEGVAATMGAPLEST